MAASALIARFRADDTDPGLADTGGPALPIGLAGVAAVGLGLALVRRSRRG